MPGELPISIPDHAVSAEERERLVEALRLVPGMDSAKGLDEVVRQIEAELEDDFFADRSSAQGQDLKAVVEACANRQGGLQALAQVVRRMQGVGIARAADPSKRTNRGTGRPYRPPFTGDAPSGPDLLGIQDDARALAMLISAKSLRPPLAIGLYGAWGTGKTYFMHTLEDQINELVESSDLGTISRVVSVWFNAWHYADGNLWASLVHQIFQSLRREPETHDNVLNGVLRELEDARAMLTKAELDVENAARAVSVVREQLGAAEERYQNLRARSGSVHARDVWAAISVDASLRAGLDAASRELGLPALGPTVREAAHAAAEVQATVRHARRLATAGAWWKSPLSVGVAVAAILSGLTLFCSTLIKSQNDWLGPAAATIGQFGALIGGASGWLVRQNKLARRLLAPAERIQSQIELRLAEAEMKHVEETATLQSVLGEAESALVQLQREVAERESRRADMERELARLTGPRLLDEYLQERLNRAEYEPYLGLVALAHRDLRDLDRYLRSMNPGSDSADRIVLYIDDLDRCSPDAVVRVLEAVHLLLALPLFVVVVGVDDRWLGRSLRARLPVLLGRPDDGGRASSPSDYLDKIFQLTYRLPEMSTASCVALLLAAVRSPQQRVNVEGSASQPADLNAVFTRRPLAAGTSGISARDADLATLELGDSELRLLPRVAPLVGTSPRIAKRFINVYRVIRARANISVEVDQLKEVGALLTIVALVIGVPALTHLMENSASEPAVEGLSVFDWLDRWHSQQDLDSEISSRVGTFLLGCEELGTLQVSDILEWLQLVRRFAWPMQD